MRRLVVPRVLRRAGAVAVTAAATLALTGCADYAGLNSLPLPGTVGTVPGTSYEVKVRLSNADSQVPNTPVLVGDHNVGTVTDVGLDGWTPVLTLSVLNEVKLPANAVAALGQTSLLGAKHIELAAPPGEAAVGVLQPGAVIAEDRTKKYPTTEDMLAGVSLLLNGGGLQHFETITTELNRALGGREQDTRELLTQLNSFAGQLDAQSADIVTTLKGLDRLGGTLAPRMEEINIALQTLPAGLRTLDEQEPALREALDRLGESASSIAPFAEDGSKELRGVLRELEPTLRRAGDVKDGTIPRALRLVPVLIFPLDWIPYLIRGDYANLNLPVNLTLDSLDKGLLTGTPAAGTLHSVAGALRGGSPATQSRNPLVLPSDNAGVPSGPLPAAPKAPSDNDKAGLLNKTVPGIGG